MTLFLTKKDKHNNKKTALPPEDNFTSALLKLFRDRIKAAEIKDKNNEQLNTSELVRQEIIN